MTLNPGTSFHDIPRFTHDGKYRVDVSLEYLSTMLTSFRDDYGLDMNVDFQRAHVWTNGQAVAFVEFVLRDGSGSRDIRFNCPGWSSKGKCGPMAIVDGKQRLTACMRFLSNEIPAFGLYYRQFKGRIGMLTGLTFLVNDLPTRAEVLQWYLDINTGGTVHTNSEIRKVRALLRMAKVNSR